MSNSQPPVAIVTGAASGIGRALCVALAARRVWIVAADVDGAGLAGLAATVDATGGQIATAIVDVRDAAAVQALVDRTMATHGRLDWLYNNAGITLVGEVAEMTLDQWNRIIDVNLRGILHGVAAAYPIMIKQGFGHIVNTASGMGLSPSPLLTAYSTTKYGVMGLSLGLRAEAQALGVKVSVVCPGFIRSSMFDSATMIGASVDDLIDKVPFRIRDAADCAAAILRGVDRNAGIIMYPGYVRFFWWLYWLAPGLLAYFDQQKMKAFRRVRAQTPFP
jgi:NAD(P)-dependent dehydrogenase (short-subunit alcohol dehydrogenase family)